MQFFELAFSRYCSFLNTSDGVVVQWNDEGSLLPFEFHVHEMERLISCGLFEYLTQKYDWMCKCSKLMIHPFQLRTLFRSFFGLNASFFNWIFYIFRNSDRNIVENVNICDIKAIEKRIQTSIYENSKNNAHLFAEMNIFADLRHFSSSFVLFTFQILETNPPKIPRNLQIKAAVRWEKCVCVFSIITSLTWNVMQSNWIWSLWHIKLAWQQTHSKQSDIFSPSSFWNSVSYDSNTKYVRIYLVDWRQMGI